MVENAFMEVARVVVREIYIALDRIGVLIIDSDDPLSRLLRTRRMPALS